MIDIASIYILYLQLFFFFAQFKTKLNFSL